MIERPHTTGIGKRLVDEEDSVRPAHAAAVGGGAASVAWGVPRLRFLGVALRTGAREHSNPKTREALRHAEGVRRAWLTGTQPVDRLGRLPGVSALGHKVPKKLQPAAAVVGGLAALHGGVPVESKTYKPVAGW